MSKGGISTQLTQLHIEMQWDRIDWRFDHQQWRCSLVINNDKLDKPTIDSNSMITYKMQILLGFRSNMNQPGMTTTATCWFLLASIHSSTHYLGLSKKKGPQNQVAHVPNENDNCCVFPHFETQMTYPLVRSESSCAWLIFAAR